MQAFEKQARRQGFHLVIGIDEAGRGPLAGPVVASAVSPRTYRFKSRIADSKVMTPLQRQAAFHEIHEKAYVGVGVISETVIDQINILEATFAAMHNAVDQLISSLRRDKPGAIAAERVMLLVDGNRFRTQLPYFYQTVPRADEKIFSVACASIVAKVTRDRILTMYDRILPAYGFKQHKGYPTKNHKHALQRLGPTFIHRRSFRPTIPGA